MKLVLQSPLCGVETEEQDDRRRDGGGEEENGQIGGSVGQRIKQSLKNRNLWGHRPDPDFLLSSELLVIGSRNQQHM